MVFDRSKTDLVKNGFIIVGILLIGAVLALIIVDYLDSSKRTPPPAAVVNPSVDPTTLPPEELVKCINGYLYTVRYSMDGRLIYAHPVSESLPDGGYSPVVCTER